MQQLLPRDTALRVKITHTQPIEIRDFTATMSAIGSLFESFCREKGDSAEARKAKLYVNKVEHGSIEIFLVETFSMVALPFMEYMNVIWDFASHVKSVVEYYAHGKGEKPELSAQDCRSYGDVFAITAGDNNGSTEIAAVNVNSPQVVFNGCTFNFSEGNAAQNLLRKEEQQMRSPMPESVYNKQLLTIHQVRSDMATERGNMGKIENITPRPLALVFDRDELKYQMLKAEHNPINCGFIVDVEVQFANGKAAAYKILALHGTVPLE